MPKVKVVCQQCGKDFEVYNSQYKRGNCRFCSKSCSTTYRNTHNNPAKDAATRLKISLNHADVSGINNPMFGRVGKKCPGYIDGRTQFKGASYRNKALTLLPWKCVVCNKKLIAKKEIHVHHKDEDRENGNLSNLVILCQYCHNYVIHKHDRNNKGQFK